MMSSPDDAYDRGHIAGEINARLAGHDKHFATVNGSLVDIAHELHAQTLAIQRLNDNAEANAKTVLTTAAALKDAEEVRRTTSEQTWSPVSKLIAVIGAMAALATVIAVAFTMYGK